MSRELLRDCTEGTADFDQELDRLAGRGQSDLDQVEPAVREIIARVRDGGDAALLAYVEQFEHRRPERLYEPDYRGEAALKSLPAAERRALESSAARIREYHERQRDALLGFEYEKDGVTLTSRVRGLERVGVYAPGGKARYPSSVLMSAIPAKVAGVAEIVVATPTAVPAVRAACHLAGVQAILDAGGAQAIAALAHGTESVPRVDKIVGPGNLYVAAAKRLVFGTVAIDSIAGPTEILVLSDATGDPELLAADLLSQAEHDEAAYPLLCTTHAALLPALRAALARQLNDLPKKDVASASLEANGVALVVNDLDSLVRVANRIAAEHVAVHVENARGVADRIDHAGAIFVGPDTPEAAGDYMAGPSHVLPTGGSARFDAPLGVYDFLARTSLIEYESSALAAQADDITAFARAEGLEAHARAVERRRPTRG